jgi:hypothetical protein
MLHAATYPQNRILRRLPGKLTASSDPILSPDARTLPPSDRNPGSQSETSLKWCAASSPSGFVPVLPHSWRLTQVVLVRTSSPGSTRPCRAFRCRRKPPGPATGPLFEMSIAPPVRRLSLEAPKGDPGRRKQTQVPVPAPPQTRPDSTTEPRYSPNDSLAKRRPPSG